MTQKNTPKSTRRKVSDKRLAQVMADFGDLQDELKPLLDKLEEMKATIVEGVKEREETVVNGTVQAVYTGETKSHSYPKKDLDEMAKRSKALRALRKEVTYASKVSVKRKHS